MNGKIPVKKGTIEETLLLPLWGRAFETKLKNPRIIDTKAVEILEKLDYDFSEIEKTQKISQHGWVARSLQTDKMVKKFITQYPQATIVNIGCGLDTTFSRIDNGKILFYELDLPDVIKLRKNFYQDSDRHKSIASSFLETDYFKHITVTETLLFLAGGVFYYFSEKQIKEFFIKAGNYFNQVDFYFDTLSPQSLKMAKKQVLKKGGMALSLQEGWGLKKVKDIIKWDQRISIRNATPLYKGTTSQIPLVYKMIFTLADIFGASYMVHAQIQKSQKNTYEKEVYWSRFAHNFEAKNNYVIGIESMNIILDTVATLKNLGKTLELACGNGTYSKILSKNATTLLCTDFSEQMVAVSTKLLRNFDNIKVEQANCFELPYPNQSFDTIFMANLLHIIPTPKKALAEAKRVLKQDGKIIIVDFTTEGMSLAAKAEMGKRYLKTYGKPPAQGQKIGISEMQTILNECKLHIFENKLIGSQSKAVFAIAGL